MSSQIYKKSNFSFFIFFYFCISIFLYSSNQYSRLSNEYEVNNYNGKTIHTDNYERRKDGYLYLIGEKEKYTGRVIGTYFNGKIEKILNVSNGRYNGEAFNYYTNGSLNFKFNYQNDLKNGDLLEFYQNGKIKSQRKYINDVMMISSIYAENGKTLVATYKNIKDNMGEIINYHKNGKIKSQSIVYIEDYIENGQNKFNYLYDGLGKYYDEKGNLAGEMVLDKNKTYGNEMKLYYPNGNVQYYAIMGESVKEYIDKIIEYYDNGQIKQDCTETSGSWSCLTYSKDGTYKGIAQGKPKTYSNLWVNIGLAFLNVLF